MDGFTGAIGAFGVSMDKGYAYVSTEHDYSHLLCQYV
jgi:hypothetical protein